MAAMPFMPLYIADYMADAAHLTTTEHGAYMLLLMTYWQKGGPLPTCDKKLARICRLDPRLWKRIKPTLVEFFVVTSSGFLLHRRVEIELSKVRDKSLKNRNGGLARAKQLHSERIATAEITLSHTDTEADTYKEESNSPSGECASSDALKPDHIFEKWNDVAILIGRPQILKLSPSRRQLLKGRIGQHTLDEFLAVFDKVQASPFLRGDMKWAGVTFDWLFKAANFQKVLEGNYDD